jgi:predicted nucleic acid-binding protein
MRVWTRTPHPAPDPHGRGLVDTSVVIDLDRLDAAELPEQLAVAAITMTELAAGPTPPTTRSNGRVDRTGCSLDDLEVIEVTPAR